MEASDSGVLDVNDSDSIESPAESDDDVFDTNDSDSMAEPPAESDENEAIPASKFRCLIIKPLPNVKILKTTWKPPLLVNTSLKGYKKNY